MPRNVVSTFDELGHCKIGKLRRVLLDDLLQRGEVFSVVHHPSAQMIAQATFDAQSVFIVLQRQIGADGTAWLRCEHAPSSRRLV